MFHTNYYIPLIEILVFRLAHIKILGEDNCHNKIRESFGSIPKSKYVETQRDYAEILSDSV